MDGGCKVIAFPGTVVEEDDPIANPKPGDVWESGVYRRRLIELLDENLRPSNKPKVWVKYKTARSTGRCRLDKWWAFCRTATLKERGKTYAEESGEWIALTDKEKSCGLLSWSCSDRIVDGERSLAEDKVLNFTWGKAIISGPWLLSGGGHAGWSVDLHIGGQVFNMNHIGYTGCMSPLTSPIVPWKNLRHSGKREEVVLWISVLVQALALGAGKGDPAKLDAAMTDGFRLREAGPHQAE